MIKQAEAGDTKIAAELAILLWPENDINALENEMREYIISNNRAVFISYSERTPIGFAQCSLRSDYVEGTKSSPVGYLEGVFVKEEFRKSGFGKKLILQCEDWARNKGCSEFASDCELNNTESLQFHLRIGFEEANRIICFKKSL
ncbi:MAG: GNAT family N-acetyltransferase [Mobilitalea sp.]